MSKSKANIETSSTLHNRDWTECKPDDYRFFDSGRYRVLFNLVQKYNPKIIFDIGCGSGFLGGLIKASKPEVTIHGCDLSDIALQRAKSKLDQVWKVDLDSQDIPVPSNRYDVVVCSEVLEHIYDVDHAIREMYRIAKPQGVGLITVPNLVYWRYRLNILWGDLPIPVRDDRHLHQFNQQNLTLRIQKLGMDILSVDGYGVRFPKLVKWKPSLFSDTLVFEVKKPY